MDKVIESFRVERTCTEIISGSQERISRPLKVYREHTAYVLLGDPGAGKTEAFRQEAKESGGEYVTARDFATFEPNTEYHGKVLFIDGLDEMRAGGGDGRKPFDQLRKHLERLGRPRFRLSCREADWLGANDTEKLMYVSQDQKVVALHLDPLTDEDILEILRNNASISDADGFIQQARQHGLDELLRNPQTLKLLVQAVGDKQWPQSRSEVYEMACLQLVREINTEHRQATRDKLIPDDTLLDAAGYLCAIQLLSGLAGFALDDDAIGKQHTGLKGLANPAALPLTTALAKNLFQGDGNHRRVPTHRSVAEYLGARYIAHAIENQSLPGGRVAALMTGEDGGIVTDLRGLSAWLSVHCRASRALLIERDPLGVVLYGDVKRFPVSDKKRILDQLLGEACRYPWFRSDDWSSSPFGALGTMDMESTFKQILASSSREDADQALLDCVIDAIRHGECMRMLAESLTNVARDASYWPGIRKNALKALLRVSPDDMSQLLKLAKDIQAGAVEDRDDEILGILLDTLYPSAIPAAKILDYLHPPKDRNLIGSYFFFWRSDLSDSTKRNDLPFLLDQLAEKRADLRKTLDSYNFNRLTGPLLARGLEEHGESIADERLYDWLGIGLDEYDHPRLEKEQAERVAHWLRHHPDRYKAIIERGVALCAGRGDHLYRCASRLYGAIPPRDIGIWYLEKAATERQSELAEYFFGQAVRRLIQEGGQQDLIPAALEFLDTWVNAHPKFQPWLEPFITCYINGWQQEHAILDREDTVQRQEKKNEWLAYYRKYLSAIRDGSAPAKILHDLSLAHKGLLYEARGETPEERLDNFLDGDKELIAAAYEGFRKVLTREDLPGVAEIIDLGVKGRMHFIRWPCLVGMDEWYQSEPSDALKLDDAVLSRLVAFRLTDNTGDDPAWFVTLLQERPALAAEVLVAYALPMLRAVKDHVAAMYQIAYNDAYAGVARIALPALLEGFPLRARKNQLTKVLDPLMKGALHYLDEKVLEQLIARKLELKSIDAAQRVYWLACGMLISSQVYEAKLMQYIAQSQVRKHILAGFFHSHSERRIPYISTLPDTTVALLVELLAPDCSPARHTEAHWVSPAMETADLVRSFVNTLGGSTNTIAAQELERLLALPSLSAWRNILQGALHSQRIARRKASFSRLGSIEVSRTLANLQPASPADLAALAFDHLRDISRNIRHGNTNDYTQYWSYDESNKKLSNSKPENACRDALLSDLKARLGKLGVDAQKEGNYADEKRADIRVSFNGANGFNVPIEIKKDNYKSHTSGRRDDLWSAIRNQLIAQYVRDPGTGGHGIYLVFWFGGEGMPPPPDGKKPRNAKELEDRLRSLLVPEERHRILVCVIDCSLPNAAAPRM